MTEITEMLTRLTHDSLNSEEKMAGGVSMMNGQYKTFSTFTAEIPRGFQWARFESFLVADLLTRLQ